MAPTNKKKARWGYVRGTQMGALPVAIGIGIPLAIVVGIIALYNNPRAEEEWVWWASVLIFSSFMAVPTIALVWTILVDRATMPGATPNPELSVETYWKTQAGNKAFYVVVWVAVIGSFIFDGTTSHVLIGLALFGLLVNGVLYLWEKNK